MHTNLAKLCYFVNNLPKQSMARRPDRVDRAHAARAGKVGRGSCCMKEICSWGRLRSWLSTVPTMYDVALWKFFKKGSMDRFHSCYNKCVRYHGNQYQPLPQNVNNTKMNIRKRPNIQILDANPQICKTACNMIDLSIYR